MYREYSIVFTVNWGDVGQRRQFTVGRKVFFLRGTLRVCSHSLSLTSAFTWSLSQISTQEGELTRMYPLEGQLSQLESALHQSTETIQTLQKDRLDSLEEQRGSFTRQLSAKDKEIGTLRLQVKELSDQVASLLEELSRKQSQQYNLSQSLHSNTSHSERRRRRRIARTKER